MQAFGCENGFCDWFGNEDGEVDMPLCTFVFFSQIFSIYLTLLGDNISLSLDDDDRTSGDCDLVREGTYTPSTLFVRATSPRGDFIFLRSCVGTLQGNANLQQTTSRLGSVFYVKKKMGDMRKRN